MKLGLFTPVFGKLSVKEMLAKVRSLEKITAIELGTGAWPGSDHVDLDGYLKNKDRARDFRQMIADAGLTISALSCHGDPLHPNKARQRRRRGVSQDRPACRAAGSAGGRDVLGLPGRFGRREASQLGDDAVAA